MSESGVSSVRDVALIVGGGPGISSSCAKLFSAHGMRVGVAARKPDNPELQSLKTLGVHLYACDASDPSAVEHLFHDVTREMGVPRLVIHDVSRQGGTGRKHGAGTDAEGHSRRKRSDRRCDRLHAA